MDRILVLLHHPGNRRLLSAWLGQHYDVRAPETEPNLNEPCDLVVVDGMVVERYGQAAELQILGNSKRIQTRVTLPSPPVAVQADAHRLMQILTNLLSNAYKYASEDTVVTVQVSLHDQMAQVAVIDQGMGIAKADQNQLFTMFFRAAAVRHSKVRGAGLGLYITRMLLEMQNGQIGVKSCPGKGSTCSCRLPLAVAQPSDVTTLSSG